MLDKKNTKEKEINIDEIINYNFAEELNLKGMNEEEREEYNTQLFAILMERIIEKTSENFTNNDKDEVIRLLENSLDFSEVFNFIAERNDNLLEEIGGVYFDFKKEIYELLNIDNK